MTHPAYPNTTLLNLYGMIETASNVAAYDTAALSPEAHRVPVGQSVAGASITVRDRLFRELPPGVTGEVWVSGEPLAIGYVNDDAAPVARFVRADDGTVHYWTGDRGRSDNQVKIRGYRVELEELEATLCKATSVTGAGACVTEQRGERQLMACVTAGDGADPTALRAFLRDRLPDYMVPVKVLVLPDLPLGANGKLDRSVLATLADNAVQDTRDGFAPADEVERTVADIWTQLLGAAPGTRTDNFFDVGGHSLLAVRLANRLERAFGYRITLRQILNSPTLSGIVKLCRDATKGGAA